MEKTEAKKEATKFVYKIPYKTLNAAQQQI